MFRSDYLDCLSFDLSAFRLADFDAQDIEKTDWHTSFCGIFVMIIGRENVTDVAQQGRHDLVDVSPVALGAGSEGSLFC